MTHRENTNYYLADEGKTFIRKSDGFDMGQEISLGVNDSIENYKEVIIEPYENSN
jgi:hypothetical protein